MMRRIAAQHMGLQPPRFYCEAHRGRARPRRDRAALSPPCRAVSRRCAAAMTPDSAPPTKPAPTCSAAPSLRLSPPVIAFDTAAVSGNWLGLGLG
eukprot:scaffold34_cov62-Phaeocystis_antarctica.AAC.12